MKNRLPFFNPALSGVAGVIRGSYRMAAVLVLLLGLAFGISRLLVRIGHPPPTGSAPTTVTASGSGSHPYFQSGRWLADARTLVAMFRYLMDTESGVQTNATAVAVASLGRPLHATDRMDMEHASLS
jgi:hypothetical protein